MGLQEEIASLQNVKGIKKMAPKKGGKTPNDAGMKKPKGDCKDKCGSKKK